MGNSSLLAKLAFYASFLALAVIALGAFTRLIDAGLGCPDWPGCYGQIIAPVTQRAQQVLTSLYPGSHFVLYKAWAEMIHRYFVGGLSLFILMIITVIISKKECRKLNNMIYAVCLLMLLVYQITLGQLTVTLKLLPVVVTQHLLGGFLILAILWLIYLSNRIQIYYLPSKQYKELLPWAFVALIFLFLQIILGAWTSTNYASLSCAQFPFCMKDQLFTLHLRQAFDLFAPLGVNYEGGVLPIEIRQTIQMTHRFGALVLTTYLFIFMAIAVPKLMHEPELMKPLYLLLGLLCLQLCLGISNVVFKLPLVVAISHSLIAVIMLLVMLTFIYKLAVTPCKVSAV